MIMCTLKEEQDVIRQRWTNVKYEDESALRLKGTVSSFYRRC